MARAIRCASFGLCVHLLGMVSLFGSKSSIQVAEAQVDTSFFVWGSAEACMREVQNLLLGSAVPRFSMTRTVFEIHDCVSRSVSCSQLIWHERPNSKQWKVSFVPITQSCGTISWSAAPQLELNNLYRRWSFRIPPAWALRFKFTYFDIPHYPKCLVDQVRLYQDSRKELTLEPLCGYRRPLTFFSLSRSLEIVLDLWRPGPQTVARLEGTYEWLPKEVIQTVGRPFAEVQGSAGRLPEAPGPALVTGMGQTTSVYRWRVVGGVHSILSFTVDADQQGNVTVFDGPDEYMPEISLQEDENVKTSGHIGFVVLTMVENGRSAQTSFIKIAYVSIVDNRSPSRCLRTYVMANLDETLTVNLLDVTGRNGSARNVFRLCQVQVSTVSKQYIMVQFLKSPESVEDIDSNMNSCTYSGLLLEEQNGQNLVKTGPLCEQEALMGLDGSVYTSATLSLNLTYFCYGLERLWTFFENIKVRFKLSPCSGSQALCQTKSRVNVALGKDCYNIHSLPQNQLGSQADCLLTLTSADNLNILGSLQVYVPKTQWTIFQYVVNRDGEPVKRLKSCTETIAVDAEGTGAKSVDAGNTNLLLGSKAVSLRHSLDCPQPSRGAYHFHAWSDPCEEHWLLPPSSMSSRRRSEPEIFQRLLTSGCGKVTIGHSSISGVIVILHLDYSDDDATHYALSLEQTGGSYSDSAGYCFFLCSVYVVQVKENDKEYTWMYLTQLFRWKTKATSVTVIIQLKPCWEDCWFRLSYQALPPSMALATRNSRTHDGFCEIQGHGVTGHYMASVQAQSWKLAEGLCLKNGAHLVTLNSKEELRALLLAASSTPECGNLGLIWDKQFVFIGLDSLEQRNTFRWSNGDPPAFTEWVDSNSYPAVTPPKAAPVSTGYPKLCTAMSLYTPEEKTAWHEVDCAQELQSAALVCERTPKEDNGRPPVPTESGVAINNDETEHCSYGWNVIGGSCFMLFTPSAGSFVSMQEEAKTYCAARGGQMAKLHVDNITVIETYLDIWHHQPRHGGVWLDAGGNDSIPGDSCTVLLPNSEGAWALETVACHLPIRTHRMHVLCQRDTTPALFRCRSSHFQCAAGACIHSEYRCDKEKQCPDGSDELGCDVFLPGIPPDGSFAEQGDGCGAERLPLHFECVADTCIPVSRVCDGIQDCLDGLDEAFCHLTSVAHGRECSYPLCEHEQVQHPDKRLSILEPPSDKDNKSSAFPCHSEHYQSFGVSLDDLGPCASDFDGVCMPRYMSCILDYGIRDKVCDNEITFDSCLAYRCPGYFKCRPQTTSGGYCIPLSRVCDGHRDCELGEDEQDCRQRPSSPGSFWCPRSKQFLSQSKVCDGLADCQPREQGLSPDELFCDVTCPPGCLCIGYGIMCRGLGLASIPVVSLQTKALILPDNKLAIEEQALSGYELLVKIDFSGNHLTKLDFLTRMHAEDLLEIDLSRNALTTIRSRAFSYFEDLVKLDLTKNALTYIAPYAFHNLRRLRALHLQDMNISDLFTLSKNTLFELAFINLSHNRIYYLGVDSFKQLEFLERLDLRGNPLHLIHPDTFKDIFRLKRLNVTEFKFCCAAQENTDRCDPQPDEFSSCNDLMGNSMLRICVWMLGLLGVFANLAVMLWRRQDQTPLAFLIQNLGISDFMMGIYMLIIGGADAHYSGKYYLYDEIWRASITCRIAGFISMLSSEMSVYVLVLITLDRLYTVVVGGMGMGPRICKVLLVAGWVVFSVLSALPIAGLSYFGTTDYIRNGVCFLFNLTEGKIKGWQYATSIFIGFNLTALCILVVGYAVAFVRISMQASGLSGTVEGKMAQRMSLIVLTDCMCWIPPIVIGLLSLQGHTIHPQVAVWVAVFVFPINSSLNPFLYTFSTTRCDSDETAYDEESEEERVNAEAVAAAALETAVESGANAKAPTLELAAKTEEDEPRAATNTKTDEKEHGEEVIPQTPADMPADAKKSLLTEVQDKAIAEHPRSETAGQRQDCQQRNPDTYESRASILMVPRRKSSRMSSNFRQWMAAKSRAASGLSPGVSLLPVSSFPQPPASFRPVAPAPPSLPLPPTPLAPPPSPPPSNETKGSAHCLQGVHVVTYSKNPETLEEEAVVTTVAKTNR